MKISLLTILMMFSTVALAKEVKDFNKVLMDEVSKDIKTENDQAFKTPTARAPASVEIEHENEVQPNDNKIDKNLRQIGANRW